jgi:predicted metal-binding protein
MFIALQQQQCSSSTGYSSTEKARERRGESSFVAKRNVLRSACWWQCDRGLVFALNRAVMFIYR